MRGLSREEIFELLATIRPKSPQEREMKRRAQEYLAARDAARREDAAKASGVAEMRRTCETARALMELRCEVLASAIPSLGGEPNLLADVRAFVSGKPAEPEDFAGLPADDQVSLLTSSREAAFQHALGFDPLADRVIAVLGEQHAVTQELEEAKELL